MTQPEVDERTQADRALEQVFELTEVMSEFMQFGLNERGLTPARAEVIYKLRRAGAMTQRQLSDALRVTPRNVTGLLDGLQAQGFIHRGSHPTDRRATLVTLTDDGLAVADALAGAHREFAETLFAAVRPRELATFIRTLEHVLEGLRGETPQLRKAAPQP